MLVLNYSRHKLTPEQLEQLSRKIGEIPGSTPQPFDVRELYRDINETNKIESEVVTLAEAAQLTHDEWAARSLIVLLPDLAIAAATLLAEIHGRRGEFPPLLRRRRLDSLLGGFEIAEVVGLQQVRNIARSPTQSANQE